MRKKLAHSVKDVIYFFQHYFFFRPEILPRHFTYKFPFPFEELDFKMEDGGSVNAIHFKVPKSRGIVYYLKGNSRSIKGWGKFAKDFLGNGYDFLMIDYRGFGKSTGKRSEREMLSDMQHVYDRLKEKYQDDHLIVYGRSMGSGFATKLACDNSPRYLILDAPYYSFRKVVERFLPILPVRMVLRFHQRTDKWITGVKCHTYIIHGTRDWLIPLRHSEALQKINPRMITLIRIHGGGHNNLPNFDEYHNFVRDSLKY